MKAPKTLTAVGLLLALTACSGGGDSTDTNETVPTTSADPCFLADNAKVTAFPGDCVSDGPTAPTGAAPTSGSAAYKPLVLKPETGQLKATGNDVDVAKTSDTFSVTVRPGYRIGVHAVCEGRTDVKVTTVPDSGAALSFSCGFEGFPAEIGTADPVLVKVATTYKVSVSVPAPARWFLNFYETNVPAPKS